MKTAIRQENDEFVVIKFKQVSGLTVVINGLGSTKLRTIDQENSQKHENNKFLGMPLNMYRVLGSF